MGRQAGATDFSRSRKIPIQDGQRNAPDHQSVHSQHTAWQPPPTAYPPAHTHAVIDPTALLFSEFRWQRRMMLVLVALLFLSTPAMMWWMQSSSARTAANLPNNSNGNNASQNESTTTSSRNAPSNTNASSSGNTISSAPPPTLTCALGNCASLQQTTTIAETGNIAISGISQAGRFAGDGSSLRNVNASQFGGQPLSYFTDASHLTSGTINPALIENALTTPVNVSKGGTGTNFLANGQLLVGNGTDPVRTLALGQEGQCLVIAQGLPGFGACPGGNLQASFSTTPTNAPTLTTTAGHQRVSIQAGSNLDNDQLLQVNKSDGTTSFAVSSTTGATTVGSGAAAGQLTVNTSAPTTPTLVLNTSLGQVANVLEARSFTGQTIASVDALGNAHFGTITQATGAANLANLNLSGDESVLGAMSIGASGPAAARLQVTASAAQPGVLIKGAAGQVADLLQLQGSDGTSLLRIDAAGTLFARSLQLSGPLQIAGHIITNNPAVPTITTTLANLVPTITGNDTAGSITFTASAPVAVGTTGHVTFSAPYTSTPRVVLTASSAASAGLSVYVVPSVGGFDIVSTGAQLAAGVYSYNYIVIQ